MKVSVRLGPGAPQVDDQTQAQAQAQAQAERPAKRQLAGCCEEQRSEEIHGSED